jgi:hypothetical protein
MTDEFFSGDLPDISKLSYCAVLRAHRGTDDLEHRTILRTRAMRKKDVRAQTARRSTSPRWGEVERSEGEGAETYPERPVTPHPDLKV